MSQSLKADKPQATHKSRSSGCAQSGGERPGLGQSPDEKSQPDPYMFSFEAYIRSKGHDPKALFWKVKGGGISNNPHQRYIEPTITQQQKPPGRGQLDDSTDNSENW